MPKTSHSQNKYAAIIEKIFFDRHEKGLTEIAFRREDLETAASALKVSLPKNLGDILYSFRFRQGFPQKILATQPEGQEWIISLDGQSQYRFQLVALNRIAPNPALVTIKIPDATPEIIARYKLGDEQSLLAQVRYNRLIDIFLGLASYSLQNHLRTTVKGVGQIEIDELYVAVDRSGRQYIVPVQAKGGRDQLSVVQIRQDVACCVEKFPDLICRPIATQFMENDLIALFELTLENGQIKVVDEKHYQLVPSKDITPEDILKYRGR